MKLRVEHEIPGRIRFSTSYGRLTADQADMLLYYLLSLPGVEGAKVYERSGDGVVCYRGNREDLLSSIARFSLEDTDIRALVPEHTSRKLTDEYANKLTSRVILRVLTRILLPAPARAPRPGRGWEHKKPRGPDGRPFTTIHGCGEEAMWSRGGCPETGRPPLFPILPGKGTRR